MAAIGASDVTYTIQGKVNKLEDGRRRALVKIEFGDSSLTYPTNGIPLSGLSSAGFPNVVSEVMLVDAAKADGYVYKVDYVNNKLLMYRSATLTPAGTIASHTHTVPAGTDAAGGTSGGTVATFTGTATTAAALAEVGNTVAPAATDLYAVVIGW